MKKIFLDTNIFIDLLLHRKLDVSNADQLADIVPLSNVYMSTLSVHITFHFVKIKHSSKLLTETEKFLSSINLTPFSENIVINAMRSKYSDFEDTLQYLMAINADCNYILTRNKKDFEKIKKVIPSKIKIVTNISQIK